jgi:hypothetical protein
MLTVEKLNAFLQQIPDKRSWVLFDEEELVILSTEPNVEDRRVVGSIHICSEDMADCEECSADQRDFLRQVSNA